LSCLLRASAPVFADQQPPSHPPSEATRRPGRALAALPAAVRRRY